MPKSKPPVLSLTVFLRAGGEIADGVECFSCLAIVRAMRVERGTPYGPELRFYEQLFGLAGGWTFACRCEKGSAKSVRLMALALAHTLAVEQNAGRRVL